MPLTKCADCGREVSTEAAACPNCGRPVRPIDGPTAEPAAAQPAQAIWAPPQQAAAGGDPPTPKQKNWFRRHPILTAILAIILIAIIAAAAGKGKGQEKLSSNDPNSAPASATRPTTTSQSNPAPPRPKPSLTGPQQQAVESAQNYLSEGMGFSRTGLIQQLSSQYGEGFPKAVAIFAVDHLNVNWYQQAFQSAKNYKSDGMGFSCSGMIQQLSSSSGEKFTHAQAVYGARKAGVC